MKTIVIGGIHGRGMWERILKDEKDYDELIFTGDYWDSDIFNYYEQSQNFTKIMTLKRQNPDKVVLLLGNHDIQYLPVCMDIQERCEGFQLAYAEGIKASLLGSKELFTMAHMTNDLLVTHAGITSTWARKAIGIKNNEKLDFTGISIADFINDTWKNEPEWFRFDGLDSRGDDPTQSPVWVRPDSLLQDGLDGVNQIVGHTIVGGIKGLKKYTALETIYFVDALNYKANWEYLVITDGKMIIRRAR